LPFSNSALFDSFFIGFTLENALHKDSWNMNLIWIQTSCGNKFFNFHNCNSSSPAHRGIKIPCCSIEYKITSVISFPRLYKSKICFEGLFKYVVFSVKVSDFFALGNFGTIARWSKKGWNAHLS